MLVLKDVLRPRLKPISSGGGIVPTRQVPYRQQQVLSKSNVYICIHFKLKKVFANLSYSIFGGY